MASGTVRVNTEPDEVIDVLHRPGHLNECHPFCKEHKVLGPGREELLFYSGKKYFRKVKKVDQGLQVSVTDPSSNLEAYIKVLFRVAPRDDVGRESTLTISIETNAFRKIPRPFWSLFYSKKLINQYKAYLGSVLKGFAYHCETGKPVQQDQFGSLEPFS